MNALKHGRYATLAPVLKLEDPIEHQLISELATIDWRMNRIIAVGARSVDLQNRA